MFCLLLIGQFSIHAQQRIQPNKLTQKARRVVVSSKTLPKAIKEVQPEHKVVQNVASVTRTTATQKSGASAGTIVGNSTYDLQSNVSICNRLFVDDAGGVHATWTYSNSYDASAPDRGTAYAYSPDGGKTWEEAPTKRLEADRNGWPNIVVTESGRIVVVSHFAGATNSFGGLSWVRKDPGGEWIHEAFPVGTDTDTWARMVANGNTIHLIAARPAEANHCGLPGGLAYFRSKDAGDTWEEMDCFPGLTPESSANITGDSYAIDVNGDNIAIVLGTYVPQLLKSTDGGDTWTRRYLITVDNPLYPDRGDLALDDNYIIVSDRSYAILVDNEGNAHVWYGRLLCRDFGEGFGFIPDNTGIMYWNETMDDAEPSIIGVTVKQDADGDGEFFFDFNESQSNTYRNANISMPSAGIDGDGNLYVTYSSIVEDAVDGNNNYFRDLFAIKSTDGGATWIGPYNITNNPTEEAVYGAVARTVDTHLHVLYMSDAEIGNAVDDFSPQTAFALNEFRYVKIPIEDIADPEVRVNTHPSLELGYYPTNAIQGCEVDADSFSPFVIDYPDGDLTDQLQISGVDVSTPSENGGSWLLSVTDSDGNETSESPSDANGVPYIIPVYTDENPPIIIGSPYRSFMEDGGGISYETFFDDLDTMDVIVDTEYVDLGATVIDDADSFGCPATLTTNNTVNTAEIGTYTVTYNAVDNVGNEAEPLVRVVNVVAEDLSAPRLTLYTDLTQTAAMANGDTLETEVNIGGDWEEPGYLAVDNVDGIITEQVAVNGTVDVEKIGIYTLEYTATDNASNSTTATRYVKVNDSQPPIINLVGPSTVVWQQCGEPFDASNLGFTAFDNVDGNITEQVEVAYYDSTGKSLQEMCTTQAGTFTIRYTVADANGNTTETTRSIIVPGPCDEGPCLYTSTRENTLTTTIEIYPNPSKGLVTIDLADINAANIQVAIFNLLGALVQQPYTNMNQQSQLQLDLSELNSGVYFIKIHTSEGIVTQKLVINR